MNIGAEEVIKIIEQLESKKKNYDDCFSSKEAKLVTEWNRAVDECINTIIAMYKN